MTNISKKEIKHTTIMPPIHVRYIFKKVHYHAARVLIVPLNDACRTTIFLTCSVKALISIMQACDSLIGNVGGEHISTAKVCSILISVFLIIQYMLAL